MTTFLKTPTSNMLLLLIILLIEMTILHAHKCESEWKDELNYAVPGDRIYYVACVEEEWDYAPSGKNLVADTEITEKSHEATWLWGNGVDRIGRVYWKALYREYTDICFTTQKRSEADEHLGSVGPIFRALTTETIKVYYKNMCTFDTSIHPHGVKYEKTSEGAPYVDDDGVTGGDRVPADGGKFIYIWEAREDMVDMEDMVGTSSKMWLYHSHVSTIADLYAGLFGAIIVTKKGMETSDTNLVPKDIDRDFVTFFVEYDENNSGLLDKNLALISEGDSVVDDAGFIESNKMHSINGYLFGNLYNLIMNKDETVRWHTCSIGNELDGPHSPHWHANIVVDSLGDHTDTLVLIAGTTYTATMIAESAGKWLYHCHVFDHIAAGMLTTYIVNDDGDNGGNECNINQACDHTDDCCDNAKDLGVICYKNGKCCVKNGNACVDSNECCKKNSVCHNEICIHSRLLH